MMNELWYLGKAYLLWQCGKIEQSNEYGVDWISGQYKRDNYLSNDSSGSNRNLVYLIVHTDLTSELFGLV